MGKIRRKLTAPKPLTLAENYDRLVMAHKKLYGRHKQMERWFNLFLHVVKS